jgi:hypothetical protein
MVDQLEDLNDSLKVHEQEVKEKVASSNVELKLEGMPAMEEAKQAFEKKYGKKEDEKIELKLESSQEFIKAREEVKKKYDFDSTEMKTGYDLKQKAADLAEKAKTKAGELGEKVKSSEAGKAVLGDDGKLDKEDLKKMGKSIKDEILGDDGKLTGEDFTRMADDIVEGGVELFKKAKESLFGKK